MDIQSLKVSECLGLLKHSSTGSLEEIKEESYSPCYFYIYKDTKRDL